MFSKQIGTLTAFAGVVAVSVSVIISAFNNEIKENTDKINEEINNETKNKSLSILCDSQYLIYQLKNKPFISSPLVPKEKQQKLNKVISKRYTGLANTSAVTLGVHDDNQYDDDDEHFDQLGELGEYNDVNKYYNDEYNDVNKYYNDEYNDMNKYYNDESDNDLEDNAKYYELEEVGKYFEVHDGCDYIDADKESNEESDEDQEKYFDGYANEVIVNYNELEDVSKYFKYFEVHDGYVGKSFEVHDGCDDIGAGAYKESNEESDDDLEKYFEGYNTNNANGNEGSEDSDDDYESDENDEYEARSDEDDECEEYFENDEFENNEFENVKYIDPNPKSGKIVKLEITEDEKRAASLNLIRSFEQLEKLLENEGYNVEIPRPDY
ncbi:2667_t:CDS:2 [Diversispora eburnea]|uniref:2667_t:CDS:1 n=1 Tax=Diversispora eburnea TaxID=1213867 RepID=A0A9N9B1R3_9GLOM|nr:2667_t:CDS:2 [Diversispora eburnea]